MKIYITGVPGTGKSTLARELEKKGFYTIDMDAVKGLCDWVNLETNEKVRWYPGSSEQFFKENKFNCNKQELIELMKNNNDVIVVGVPGNRIELLDLFI